MPRRVTAAMCARGRSLSEPVASPGGAVVAVVARGAGGTHLLAVPASGGPEVVLTTEPAPLFRGGVANWLPDGAAVLFATGDGRICRVAAGGGPAAVVVDRGAPVSALATSPDGARVAYVVDGRQVEVTALGGGPPAVLSHGNDFALDPAWSPDGRTVVWHEWDVPDMPWDGGRIVSRAADGAGPVLVLGGGEGIGVQQPRFSPAGDLVAFLSDAGGWLNLWVAHPDGSGARPLVEEAREHGGPAWGPGQRSFAWSPDGRQIVFVRNEQGFGSLCRVDAATGAVAAVGRGVHSSLSWSGNTIACLRSGARTPTQVVAYSAPAFARTPLARGPVGGFEFADQPEPEVVWWDAADGTRVPGRLYAGGPRKPLVVWVHGGPTDQREVVFDARAAFLLDRGWALLFPDFRGSSGWGRGHAQALRGRWGDLDVEDVAAGARAAVAGGWCDGRVVAMGASAGGMAVLLLLARHPELFAAGVDLYGPVDLLAMARATHRFEAHYTWSLVAPLPGGEDVHLTRSPIAVAGSIRSPLLVLHGSHDEVVPVGQSDALVDKLRAAGGVVEYHVYEGEGHGWRRPETVEDELQRIESFLARHVVG